VTPTASAAATPAATPTAMTTMNATATGGDGEEGR
jgi:hypothetical protein